MTKAFITGDKGFVGRHLRKLLEEEGMEVHGYDLMGGLDIKDKELLKTHLAKIRPDYIFHLAAITSVQDSFVNPLECINTNIYGSVCLLEAVRELGLPCHIQLASSTEVYSPAIDDTPLDIGSPVQPRTPYGVAKLSMEQMASIYASAYKMHVVVTRTNNHTGPGQDGPFAVTSFARQIVEIEKGNQDILRHGDLSSFKSYLDVRDVVRAYRIAIDLDPYIYNIASDTNIEMQVLLDRLVAQAKVPIITSKDVSLVRSYAPDKTLYKTSSKLKEAGWEPEYNLERTLNDVLEYWRGKK